MTLPTPHSLKWAAVCDNKYVLGFTYKGASLLNKRDWIPDDSPGEEHCRMMTWDGQQQQHKPDPVLPGFYSNRALLAVSTVRCNHDSVVIYHEPAKIQNNILLLSCLFSAYTFFLLLLFSRWLVEIFYSVWGFIPGSEMIQLSLSECCLDKAFARHSATTELEKVCNFTEVTKIKKIKK